MQFSAYACASSKARAYRGRTRASRLPDMRLPPGWAPRRRLGPTFFEAPGFRGRGAARPVETRHPCIPARMSATPKPMPMQAATSLKKVAMEAQVRRPRPLTLSTERRGR
jgi:hypothetical protein